MEGMVCAECHTGHLGFHYWSQRIASPNGCVYDGEIDTSWPGWGRHRTTRDEQESEPEATIAVALHSMLDLEQNLNLRRRMNLRNRAQVV